MAIFDKFKKSTRKKQAPKKSAKNKVASAEKETTAKETPKKILTDLSGTSHRYLLRPHITEKANLLAEKNQYVFVVRGDAPKIEIKKAVENLYKVKVEAVQTSKIPSKRRRLGRNQGFKKGFKKAVVKLAAGEKLDIFSV